MCESQRISARPSRARPQDMYIAGRGFSAAPATPDAACPPPGDHRRPPRARRRRPLPLGHADSGGDRQGHAVRGAGQRAGRSTTASPSWTRWGSTSRPISVNDFWWWDSKDQGLARADLPAPQRDAGEGGTRMHPGRIVGMASVPLQFPELAAEMLQDAVNERRARRDRRRARQRREPVAAEVRSVLGEGRRDGRARVHAPERLRQHHQGGRRWPAAAASATSSATRSRRRCSCRG